MHGPGSPPRGRGKVDGPPAQVGRGRITPAQAGRSPYFLYGKKDYKDHPRIGGEKAELTAAVISAMGSPPRRRGKGYREFGIDISDRITPAQAGKSVAPRQKRSALWDHPRVGGEKLVFHVGQRGQRGSPPRGRGKVFDPYFLEYGSKDHPRVGGEKLLQFALPLLLTGSPPRGRGKGRPPCTVQTIQRITPAWAGKRRNRGCCAAGKGDHPRVGGEKRCSGNTRIRPRGSPPRGRGKASLMLLMASATRITPAWAGKSTSYLRSETWWRDHPRVGGEKPPPLEREALYLGSPPRGRGKGTSTTRLISSGRITPAWAGKSP